MMPQKKVLYKTFLMHHKKVWKYKFKLVNFFFVQDWGGNVEYTKNKYNLPAYELKDQYLQSLTKSWENCQKIK